MNVLIDVIPWILIVALLSICMYLNLRAIGFDECPHCFEGWYLDGVGLRQKCPYCEGRGKLWRR